MNQDELKELLCCGIEERRDFILNIGRTVWKTPETGYREVKTAALIAASFRELGFAVETSLALTGVRAVLDTGRPGPTLLCMGELDALIIRNHPDADVETGAVHACGHNAQLAGLLGAAAALSIPEIRKRLSGKIMFFAVPAEEFIELDYRKKLMDTGKIACGGGKAELIRTGAFAGCDLAFQIHAATGYRMPKAQNGFIVKCIRFHGRGAHSAGFPERGINALYMAELALAGINAQRETFRDQDHVRVHGIITRGGDSVNIIPDNVEMEFQVRAASDDAIADASAKVDRACRGAAVMFGGSVEIDDLPGYRPVHTDPEMMELFAQNALKLDPQADLNPVEFAASSTDFGDVTAMMPGAHPSMPGGSGVAHSDGFQIVDENMAYLNPAKVMGMVAIDLLSDGAVKALEIMRHFKERNARSR